MRWYCVHPSLPLQAELRIRAAPDSSASERARISQGRAIGACSPAFQVPGDGVDAAPVSWLQVAYQDAMSGETEGGFMMADLPDGMALLTPWETTDFLGCCEVTNPAALIFDGPRDTAESVGSVPSINFLYCIVEGSEARLRLFHPELESVWVEKKDVQIVCTRLKHDACTTPHTFYELNEALPEEAQIAIREFPSKEAQAVGLLSRGETLEVIIRGGNWLQIAGGTLDKAWIMWRTDSLELLQEASDVSSGSCQPVQHNIDDFPHDEGQKDQVYSGGTSDEVATEATAAAIVPKIGVEAGAGLATDDGSTSAIAIAATIVETADSSPLMSESQASAAVIGDTEAWDDRPIQPAHVALDEEDNGDAETSTAAITEDDVAAVSSDVGICAGHVASVQEVQNWDNRPIRPAPTRHNEAEPAVADIGVTRDDKAPGKTSYEVPGDCMDDRPVQPAQVGYDEAKYDDVAFATVVANQLEKNTSDIEVSKPWDDTSTEPRITVTDDILATVTAPVENDMAASDDAIDGAPTEDKGTEASWDDRPTQPARNTCTGEGSAADSRFTVDDEDVPVDPWDDLPIRSASTVADGAGNDDAVAIVLDAVAVAGMEPVPNVELWDERPIRPAQIQLDELELDDDIVIVQDAAADDFVPAAPSLEEHAGVVQSCDDRPIKPASTFPQTRADSALNTADDAVAAADNDSSSCGRTANDGDEERALAQSWDDRLITPASTALVAPGTVTAAAFVESTGAFEEDKAVHSTAEVAENDTTGDNEGENMAPCDDAKEANDVQTAVSPDDRPIRPAQSMAADEACGRTVEVKENYAVDAPTLDVDDVGGNHDKEDMEGVAISNTVNARAIRPAEIPAVEEAGVPVTENDACARVVQSKFDTSFAERDALEDVGVSFGSPIYSNGEAKSEPMSSSEAGDIAVLGGLDDVFDPVDELIMDIRGEDLEKDVRRCESNPGEVYDESVPGGGKDAASLDSVAQTTLHTEGVDQSVAFLQEFGVIKYCEQKQSLYPLSDKLSLAMFSADQDDADLVFEVLVGDDPLSDDWFHDVASRGLQAEMFSASTAFAVSRDSVVRSTYDLIMGNGSPEDILEAELSSDNEGDFDLVVCFKYPSPQRRAIELSRASSPFRRVPSAPSRMTALEAHAESSPAKPASENGFEAEDSLLMARQPSPPSEHTPANSPPQPATKATSPPKNVLPGPPKMSTSTRSRLTQRSPIVTPSSIGKPPSALSRPRSFMQSSHLATPTRSAITKTSSPSLGPPPEASASSVAASGASPSRTARPLQRRSFLATPSPSKALGVSSSTRNSMAGSIPKPTEVSGLQAPRKSFGYRRPSGLAKKT